MFREKMRKEKKENGTVKGEYETGNKGKERGWWKNGDRTVKQRNWEKEASWKTSRSKKG